MKKGNLYLIPTPIAEESLHTLPQYVIDRIHRVKIFIAERAKTARHFIKATEPPYGIGELEIMELNKRTSPEERASFLDAALAGQDIGLMSEAGCPGVADPGALIVAMAHKKGIKVVPLVGPSSILLALMASGMNGQSFSFHGYLSAKIPALQKDLKRLEQLSARFNQTQIFIEAPYRNKGMIENCLKTLQPNTQLCIAADVSAPQEYIKTQRVRDWKKSSIPDLHKHPALFLIYA